MTPRSIRRAAERKANKQARKAAARQTNLAPGVTSPAIAPAEINGLFIPETNLCCEPEPAVAGEIEPSLARLAANRANAQLSTGPRTADGKAKVSLNAVKTGLTGRTVLLPSEDAAEYERHIHAFQKELAPVGPQESSLVQSIADTGWRIDRIFALEMGIFAVGRSQFAEAFDDREPAQRSSLIELQTFLAYEKQLRNLQLQESRLLRRREKETAELRRLQSERQTRELEALDQAARAFLKSKQEGEPFHPAAHGFEFSTAEIERYLETCPAPRTAETISKERPAAA